MRIKDFFRKIFEGNSHSIDLKSYHHDWTATYIEAFAMFVVVETIAAMMANIEYKTYKNQEENKSEEWYSLNVRPNETQNSSEFWQEFWCRLLYDQEVLVVQDTKGKRIIADNFSSEYVSADKIKFTNVSRNSFSLGNEFYPDDVWYLRYTNNNIRYITDDIFRMYNDMTAQAQAKYAKNAGERGVLEVASVPRGDAEFEKRFSNLIDNEFKEYFSKPNAVIPVFNGMKYVPTTLQTNRTISEVTDVSNLIADAIARVAQIYKISPALV